MSTPDNIDYLFRRLRELNADKDFYINEEDESFLLLKKLSKLNIKITIIKESLISRGYNV